MTRWQRLKDLLILCGGGIFLETTWEEGTIADVGY